MDYAQIRQALIEKKSEKTKKALAEEQKRAEEEKKPKKKGNGKGHRGYYKGKPMDRKSFENAIDAFFAGTTLTEAYLLSGLSYPTFKKRIEQLCEDCYLPPYMFTDGKPMYFTYEPPSDLAMIKKELKQIKARKERFG